MKTILVIEDNPEVRENTSEILALAAYNVLTAENGKVGVELAQRELPDLILCDIMMPELDGFGVLHILSKKPETAAIPFVFLTAKAEKTDIRSGMNRGADDYLTKPFDDTDLLNTIEARLRRSSMAQRRYEATAEGLNAFIDDARMVLNLKDLCKDKKVRTYKKKGDVFAEGDAPLNVYFVQGGSVKVYRAHPDGKELITNIYNVNDFFGFEPMLENASYQESATALEDSELVLIPKQDFLSMVLGHPDVSIGFISLLSKKVEEKEKQLLHLAYNSVRQRTAEALLRVGGSKEGKGDVQISREDLARVVGTASESVIRTLSDFKSEGLIAIEGTKIHILHPGKLEQIIRWNVAR